MTRNDGGVGFTALGGALRLDTWLTNDAERQRGIVPWDPDTDEDGLTDGQETHWVTKINDRDDLGTVRKQDLNPQGLFDTNATLGTDPLNPDTDGDGYWDGWIGVYDVGRSDNVVLYMQHLRTGTGIENSEVVAEQTGVHTRDEAPFARGANVTGDARPEHSNLHLGELHWHTDPTDRRSNALDQTRLAVEVDWLQGRNPFNTTNSAGVSIIDITERNYRIYGFALQFTPSDALSQQQLRGICKEIEFLIGPTCQQTITPGSLNAQELSVIEDRYHDNESTLHVLFANQYGTDTPQFVPHDLFIPNTVRGLAGTTGSPGQVAVLDGAIGLGVPYGAVVFEDITGSFNDTHAVLMEELGHTLGAGYADDKDFVTPRLAVPGLGVVPSVTVPQIIECYSGNGCFRGQTDVTPEDINPGRPDNPTWSVMARDSDSQGTYYAFSIEEASTVDFEEIPSRD